ncbi:MAG TPA: aldo/keto reductase, partial [Anaerolineales bacterium]
GSRAALDEMAWIRDYLTGERIEAVRRIGEIALDLGVTTAQLAIAWLLRRKEVSSVITGATRRQQLLENIAAGDAIDKLSNAVLERIEEVLNNLPEEL